MAYIHVFAGLGSEVLFKDTTRRQALRDSSSSKGRVLLETCHQAFIDEVLSISTETQRCRIDLGDFGRPDDLLHPHSKYHKNAIIQNATLCLTQLLRYQGRALHNGSFDAYRIAAASGFCAGLFAAVAVATARDSLEFLLRAKQCFRLAIVVGAASEAARESLGPLFNEFPWSIVAKHVDKKEISELATEFGRDIFVSASNSPDCVTISGPGDALNQFNETMLQPRCSVKATNIFSPYHDHKLLTSSRDKILRDYEIASATFPAKADLVAPIISGIDGCLIQSSQRPERTLLAEVLDMILIAPTDWVAVQNAIVTLADSHRPLSIFNYGPGYGALTHYENLPDEISVVDVSAELDATELSDHDIAIIGVGLDLPDASDLETLWQNLKDGLNSCSDIPSERFQVEDYYTGEGCKPLRDNRSMRTKYGNFLKDPFLFDNQLFGISPREAPSIDPQQRLVLSTVHRALEHSGYVPDSTPSFSRNTFGCFIGNATMDHVDNLRDNIDVYYSPGTLRAFLSGRVSYAYKWSGPCATTDTACSSSLFAIYQAARALLAGDCRAAVAGGVNVITSPDMYLGLDKAHFLSPTGQCKAFDEAADGYCRSEGCAVFVLKRAVDAVAENDRILGIIKGTQAGDPNELRSIRAVLSEGRAKSNPLFVTSIKANLGHAEAASGGAGLAKLLAMLRNGQIPPQILLNSLNPAIEDLGADGTLISTTLRDWQVRRNQGRIALLNNFGAAGSNAALLLQESSQPDRSKPSSQDSVTHVFGCSARTLELLEKTRQTFIAHLSKYGDELDLADVCYSSTVRRGLQKFRLSTTASNISDLITRLQKTEPVESEPMECTKIFLFGGQGSQYLGMGQQLMELSTVFRKIVLRCNELLVTWGYPGCLNIIQPQPEAGHVSRHPDTVQAYQTAVFVLEIALVRFLASLGIRPTLVAGHSIGEFAALVAADVLDIDSGLWLVAERARLIVQQCTLWETSMLAVNMLSAEVREIILSLPRFSSLAISCENSPSDCVIGGIKTVLQDLQAYLSARMQKRSVMLDVPIAYHTSALQALSAGLETAASRLRISPPAIPIASNALGRIIEPGETVFSPKYFVDQCCHTVAFDRSVADILHKMPDSMNEIWIELGPHPTLLPMVTPHLSSAGSERLPLLMKGQHPSKTIANFLARIYGDTPNHSKWRSYFAGLPYKPRLIDLPPAPMELRRFYVPVTRELTPQARQAVLDSEDSYTQYTLLHRQLSGKDNTTFETPIRSLADLIEGHVVCGKALCPASVYTEMALAAATLTETSSNDNITFKLFDIEFVRPLLYSKDSTETISTVIACDGHSQTARTFEISSSLSGDMLGESKTHCSGKFKHQHTSKTQDKLRKTEHVLGRRKARFEADDCQSFSAGVMYKKIFSRVVSYSSDYQAVRKIFLDDKFEEIYAQCQMPKSDKSHSYAGQPILLDTMLHVAGFAANLSVENDAVCIAHRVQSMTMLRKEIPKEHLFDVHCSNFSSQSKPQCVIADVHAVDKTGLIAIIKGIEFHRSKLQKIQTAFEFASRSDASELKVGRNSSLSVPQATHAKETRSGSISHGSRSLSPVFRSNTSSGDVSETSQAPTPCNATLYSILSETTGVESKDITPRTELSSMGVDSMMVFELESKLKAILDPRPTVSEISACNTVKDIELLMSARMSAATTPAARPTSRQHSVAQIPAKDLPRKAIQRSDSATPAREEPQLPPEMLKLLYQRLGDREQPEQIQTCPSSLISTPLYLFAPGAGITMHYTRMGRLDRDVHTVQDPCLLVDIEDDWPSIEEAARNYATMIHKHATSNPCRSDGIILGGWSFGGIIAFETACCLANQSGISVRGVVLIDAPPPFGHQPIARKTIETAMAFTQKQNTRPRPKAVTEFEDAVAKLTIRNNLRRAALLGHYAPSWRHPMPKVILLRSSEGLHIPSATNLPENKWLHDRSDPSISVAAWEELLGEKIDVIDIPGDHFHPFETENVKGTTAAIKRACEMLEKS
ncbi:Orsellinic acid synthase [Pseudocercospora fuligena]|uniref:Orsellinic acid synthase n=1 Tax=Pseudocercospora fuligena TaxID=685502 RepID=A0A8H6RKV9_9PEZI|nr:Orsellinic acid synthase [Pseudocercospora fuligena]